ncbi:hypothetical protein EJ03DRAFT_323199 [Teratosphaeria nubilosa]|uniref:Uncharacterized protein n=1 Tax=Teratosphaeria nubilosa TaxID=161662 RepID=A0A6G1LLL0_9PEZI|nr:hypothetical protein EJ03DRAFT_323199 [Teratosphaeria nubilosa]
MAAFNQTIDLHFGSQWARTMIQVFDAPGVPINDSSLALVFAQLAAQLILVGAFFPSRANNSPRAGGLGLRVCVCMSRTCHPSPPSNRPVTVRKMPMKRLRQVQEHQDPAATAMVPDVPKSQDHSEDSNATTTGTEWAVPGPTEAVKHREPSSDTDNAEH